MRLGMPNFYDWEIVSGRWTSAHWWSRHFELRSGEKVVAAADVRGSTALVKIGGVEYRLERFRIPPSLSLRSCESEGLLAELKFTMGGFFAEFSDGDLFRLGWTHWTAREYVWTSDSGDEILRSRHSWAGNPTDIRVSANSQRKWPFLAILEFPLSTLS